MLAIIATILLVTLGLVAVLWIGTIWAQGYFYDAPTDGLNWRAPAAGGSIAFFLLLWMIIEFRRPETTDTFARFTREQKTEYDRFISVRKNEDGEKEIVFERRSQGGQPTFRNDQNQVWNRSMSGMMIAIIIEEKSSADDALVRRRFNAEMDGAKFAPRIVRGIEQKLRYFEEDGDRVIEEDRLGIAIRRPLWKLVVNIFLNLFHLLVWFLVCWLLLRFQWSHALFLSFVAWMAVSLALAPFLLDRARGAAKKANDKPTAMLRPAHRDTSA